MYRSLELQVGIDVDDLLEIPDCLLGTSAKQVDAGEVRASSTSHANVKSLSRPETLPDDLCLRLGHRKFPCLGEPVDVIDVEVSCRECRTPLV